MKFTINVECTSEEAREFIGLPNVAPMQERLMADLEKRMRDYIQHLDPQILIQTWIPATIQSLGVLQQIFMDQLGRTQPQPSKDQR